VPLRAPAPSQKATHGWWERAVKNNKNAKDNYVFVYHAVYATQGRAEESVTSLRSGWGAPGFRGPPGSWGEVKALVLRQLRKRLCKSAGAVTVRSGREGRGFSLPLLPYGFNQKQTLRRCCVPGFSLPQLQGNRGLLLLFNPALFCS